MAVTYEWIWGPMRVEDVGEFKDVVVGINWKCIAKDLSVSETLAGYDSGFMPTPPPSQENYVPVDQLTAEIVQSWIDQWNKRTEVEEYCLKLLQDQINPPAHDLPVPPGVSSLFSSGS